MKICLSLKEVICLLLGTNCSIDYSSSVRGVSLTLPSTKGISLRLIMFALVSKWNCVCAILGTYHIILVYLHMIPYISSIQQVNTDACTCQIGIHRQSCTQNARFHVFGVKIG
jgi:hypothetical protein